MIQLMKHLFIYFFLLSDFVSSQSIGRTNVITTPKLRKFVCSLVLLTEDELFLRASLCGRNMVCREDPSDAPSMTPFTSSERNLVPRMGLPNTTVCGLDNLGNRIRNGETRLNQFRWTVALEFNINGTWKVRCGGSLINTRYVITAAHCVMKMTPEELILRLGEWDLNSNPDCDEYDCNEAVMFATVEKIIIHEKYVSRYNDIALLKLKTALPENYTNYALPICLPSTEALLQNSFTNTNVSVAGWGATETGKRSPFKLYANLNTIDPEVCNNYLQPFLGRIKLNQSHICARSSSGACDGDSRGPLMANVNGSWHLVGIASFGPPCGKTLLPGVYTRVTAYMDWIQDNLLE